MAPMTRNMADDQLVPTQQTVDYYTRRAEAGLIITEGTIISEQGRGYSHTPGIYTDDQIKGWRRVTDAVHHAGGKIFVQLWHVGRVSHPAFLKGNLPVSASATAMSGQVARAPELTYGSCRALSGEEVYQVISDYSHAAINAMEAGFDGVELHGANGYLIDQFLHYHTNQRNDEFGGTPQKMAQFPLKIIEACGKAIGVERVGIRLSPAAYLNEMMADSRDTEVFQYLLGELSHLKLAYVHTGNFNDSIKYPYLNHQTMTEFLRTHFQGVLIACGSYDIAVARECIAQGQFDLLAIGRRFIANPDLMNRLKNNMPLCEYSSEMLTILF